MLGFKLSSAKAVQEVHRWRKVSHVNVVALQEIFTTKVFGDNCKCIMCVRACVHVCICVCICVCVSGWVGGWVCACVCVSVYVCGLAYITHELVMFILALVLVYDYHAGADTLLHRHFSQKSQPLSESLIWQYIIQLTSALRTLHHSGLAVRCIDMSKVLVLGSNRCASRVSMLITLTYYMCIIICT